MSANVKAIRNELLEAAKAGAKVASAQERLSKQREGAYTHAVMAGIAADGDAKAFVKVCEELMAEIRCNKDGIATAIKAPRAKKDDKEGNPVYKVPMSISASKTYITQALDFSVELVEDGEPRSYGSIRKDVDRIRAERARENETVEERQRREVREYADLISTRVEKLEGDALNTLHDAIAGLYNALNQSQEAAKAAESAGKALEQAAKSTTTKGARSKAARKAA